MRVGARREGVWRKSFRLGEEARVKRLLGKRLVRGIPIAGHQVHGHRRREGREEHVELAQRPGHRRLLPAVERLRRYLGRGQRAAAHHHPRDGSRDPLLVGAAEVAGDVVAHELEVERGGGGVVARAQARAQQHVRPRARRRRARSGRLRRGSGIADLVHFELPVGHDPPFDREDDAGDEAVDRDALARELHSRALVLEHQRVVVGDELFTGDVRSLGARLLDVLVQDGGFEFHVLVQRAHDHALLALLQVEHR